MNVNDTIMVVNTVITCIGMLGIGAGTDYRAVIKYLKSPVAYLVGVLTQLLLVPLLAWGLTEATRLPDTNIFADLYPNLNLTVPAGQYQQLSVLIQGCSPGGSTSNVVVFWLGGILDLSVAMTGTTTILALGFMPFWLFVFSEVSGLDESLSIPFESLGITLGSLLPPILIGMVINAKAPERFATIFSKTCILIGSVGIVVATIVGSIVRNIQWRFNWQMIIIALVMPLLGFILGYVVTLVPLLKLTPRISRTVATEVALQNAQVCSAVIQGSFGSGANPNLLALGVMVVFPLMYYAVQVGYSILFVVLYRVLKAKGHFAGEDEEIERERAELRGELPSPTTGKDSTTFGNPYATELPTISNGVDKGSEYKIKSGSTNAVNPAYIHQDRL